MAITLFNSNNFSVFSIKYLHKQPASLEEPSTIFSYGWRCTFLTNLHSAQDVFSVKSSYLQWSIQYLIFWQLQCCTYRCPSSLDLCKQISNMHTNCTQVRSCLHINVISSCYLQWPSVKHYGISCIILSDNSSWITVFPIQVYFWLLLAAHLPCNSST